jgi:prophage maintenance system killer protein
MKTFFKFLNKRTTGIQGTLFLLFATISITMNSDKFWMFMISSIVFTALQTIIDELRELNSKK